jgi:hypothetical protein
MEPFATQCTSNLKTWEARSSELAATTPAAPPEAPNHPVSPSRLPNNFFTAFPMTIPTHLVTPEEQAEAFGAWHPIEGSSSSSDVSSEHSPRLDTQFTNSQLPSIYSTYTPMSPTLSPVESVGSSLLSPRDQSFPSHYQRPSSAGSSSSVASDATTAIRAAYQSSIRKKRSMNRNSWNASLAGSASSPPPQVPKVSLANLVTKGPNVHDTTSPVSPTLSTIAHPAATPSTSPTTSDAGGS